MPRTAESNAGVSKTENFRGRRKIEITTLPAQRLDNIKTGKGEEHAIIKFPEAKIIL